MVFSVINCYWCCWYWVLVRCFPNYHVDFHLDLVQKIKKCMLPITDFNCTGASFFYGTLSAALIMPDVYSIPEPRSAFHWNSRSCLAVVDPLPSLCASTILSGVKKSDHSLQHLAIFLPPLYSRKVWKASCAQSWYGHFGLPTFYIMAR